MNKNKIKRAFGWMVLLTCITFALHIGGNFRLTHEWGRGLSSYSIEAELDAKAEFRCDAPVSTPRAMKNKGRHQSLPTPGPVCLPPGRQERPPK